MATNIWKFWLNFEFSSSWLAIVKFYGRFLFSRYCYPNLNEIHVHPFNNKSFGKFIIHTDSFSIQSSELMFINLIMLCKKVSDIWQYISDNCSSFSLNGRGLSKPQIFNDNQTSLFALLWHCDIKWLQKANGHQRST